MKIVLKAILVVISAVIIHTVLFLLVPFMNAMMVLPEKKTKKVTEVVFETKKLVKKEQKQRQPKKIRKVSTNLKVQSRTVNRASNFSMDLSLATGGSGGATGTGVGVLGGGTGDNQFVYEAGQVDQEAKVLREVEPEYPRRAYREQISARVELIFVVEKNGFASDVKILNVNPAGFGFEQAAIQAIQKTRFAPATIDGVDVRQKYTYEYIFEAESF